MSTNPGAWGLFACACVAWCANAQTPAYTVQIVPDPPVPAGAENAEPYVVGLLDDGRFMIVQHYTNRNSDEFIGSVGNWASLAPLAGDASAWAWSNAANMIVGRSVSATGSERPVLWQAGIPIDLTPSVGTGATASSVNASGVVSGYGPNATSGTIEAWTWQNGSKTPLAPPPGHADVTAMQTTESGFTVGATVWGVQAPVLWFAGVPTVLPVPDGEAFSGSIYDTNESGWVVGDRYIMGGMGNGTYLWRNGSYELLRAADMAHRAYVSNAGDVMIRDSLGTALWRDGTVHDVSQLLTPGFDGSVTWLQQMDDDGRLIAKVEVDGVICNAVLTPVPAPSPLVLVIVAGVASGLRRRR